MAKISGGEEEERLGKFGAFFSVIYKIEIHVAKEFQIRKTSKAHGVVANAVGDTVKWLTTDSIKETFIIKD